MTPQYIVVNEVGSKFYYKDKEMTILHREDGPAIEWRIGSKEWWIDGARHREDGPAIERESGYNSWYLNGRVMTEEEYLKRTAPEIVMSMDEIAAKLGIDVNKLKIVK